MILSASGWRAVFAASGSEADAAPAVGPAHLALAALMADSFADYLSALRPPPSALSVVLGIDARPTGTVLADVMLRVLAGRGIQAEYLFITAAPEIMAYTRKKDGFVYISASHNPVGHNGVKFGLNDGGVLSGGENAKVVAAFKEKCARPEAAQTALALVRACPEEDAAGIFAAMPQHKKDALDAYAAFTRLVAEDTPNGKNVTILCDMNGSARSLSIDRAYFESLGCAFHAINGKPRQIAHAIIPEPENLVYAAAGVERLRRAGGAGGVFLGYMPDCDGDRGNIVYFSEKTGRAEILKAQEVFALPVLAELSALAAKDPERGLAVAVNGPTSMRIDDIAARFGARVFRAEVGEANVVNLARLKREEGYAVRILGEGSNGGSIIHPSAVRDPLNTLTSLLKLLASRPGTTLGDVVDALPKYTTTGVTEERALLTVRSKDHGALKRNFQKEFEAWWAGRKAALAASWGIASCTAIATNGTAETVGITDYGVSGAGGLKIRFDGKDGAPLAFMWMRGSGTEPVFRVMCDVKGDNPAFEAALLEAETMLITQADRKTCILPEYTAYCAVIYE
jgi:phosphoglucomutase